MSVQRKKMRRTSRPLFVAIGAAALLVSACAAPAGTDSGGDAASGGGTDVCTGSDAVKLVDSLEGLSPEKREQTLLDAAVKAGGTLDYYTENNEPETIVDPFEEKYGDLTVNVYRAGSNDVRQRVLEESAAGISGSDLMELRALDLAILDSKKLLAPVSSPYEDQVVAAARFDNFLGDRLSYILPGWNTDLVSEGQVPTSLEDFATFDGPVALEGTDVYWFAGLVMQMEKDGKTRDEAVQVFKDLAANASITDGHTTTSELIVAGQYAISPNQYLHRLLQLQGEGAPIGWNPVNIPVVVDASATAVSCLSDNPAGALLLQDFIMNPTEGQQIYVEQNRTPAIESLIQETLGDVKIDPIQVDVAEVAKNYSDWSDLWDEVIRSGSN